MKPLFSIVKSLIPSFAKKKLYGIIKWFNYKKARLMANRDIQRVLNNTNKNRPIKIGFIVQMPTLWDKQESVYLEAKSRNNIETFMFVVPEDSWGSLTIDNNYKNNYFLGKYDDAIIIHDKKGNIINIGEYRLDYLFYPRPYDEHLPAEIRSNVMRKSVRCCYIPYGLAGADIFNGGNIYNPFFDNMYYCFMDSKHMKKLLASRYRFEINKKIKKVEYLGYPSLEKYINMSENEPDNIITWTPRWSYDEKLGGSNFMEYKDGFAMLCKNKNIKFIFRPHPLMFDELINKKILEERDRDSFLKKLERSDVEIDIESPINSVLYNTGLLISDFSSIVGTFFLTGRPIIYCDKGIELNETYKEMAEHMYVAHDWNEVLNYYQLIVIEKNDYKKEKRLEFIRNKYANEIDSAKRIVDALITDYSGNKR